MKKNGLAWICRRYQNLRFIVTVEKISKGYVHVWADNEEDALREGGFIARQTNAIEWKSEEPYAKDVDRVGE